MKIITSVSAIGLVVAAGSYWYVYGETSPYNNIIVTEDEMENVADIASTSVLCMTRGMIEVSQYDYAVSYVSRFKTADDVRIDEAQMNSMLSNQYEYFDSLDDNAKTWDHFALSNTCADLNQTLAQTKGF